MRRRTHFVHRGLARASAVALVALAAGLLSCGGDGPTQPPAPRIAQVSVAPVLPAGAAGGPAFDITALRAVLTAVDAPAESTVVTGAYTGAGSSLQADLTITSASRLYNLKLAAIDARGDTVFRGTDTVAAHAVVPGVTRPPKALALGYARADAAITALQIAPRDTTVSAGDTLRLRVAATGGATVTPAVGWTSRDEAGLTLSRAGTLTAAQLQKTVWVIATTFNGVKDSTRVTVAGAIASVAGSLDSVRIERGDSVQLGATLKDPGGTVLAGRAVTWSSTDAAAASVDAAGWVKGLVANRTALVVVSANGRSDTTKVVVAPRSVASIATGADTVRILVGQTIALGATAMDAQGAANADVPLAWTTADAAVATVTTAGSLTGAAEGATTVTAAAGGVTRAVVVLVSPVPVRAVEITSDPVSVAYGDSVRLAAVARDSAGTVLPDRPIVYTSLDPALASVDAALGLVRPAFTSATTPAVARIVAASGALADTVGVVLTPVPATVTVESGDLQVGLAGQSFLLPVTVKAAAPGGQPLAGRTIAVVATQGGGGVIGSAVTDAAGRATLAFRYGAAVGPHAFTVSAGPAGTPATVRADATLDRRRLATGTNSTCTIEPNGTTSCFGYNAQGQLGVGAAANVSQSSQPLTVVGGYAFETIAAGHSASRLESASNVSRQTCALTAGGRAYCWGMSQNNDLAINAPDACPASIPGSGIVQLQCAKSPLPVAGGHVFESITVGGGATLTGSRACAVQADGTAWCWGEGTSGELGNGANASVTAPVPVSGGLEFVQLSTGNALTCGVTALGEVWCWGLNDAGQLGDGTNAPSNVPVRVSSSERFVRVSAGGAKHACALSAAGEVWCWGAGSHGRLGIGDPSGANHSTPVKVAGGRTYATVAVAREHSCAITPAGAAYCWGLGANGQLGTGLQTDELQPAPVLGGHVFTEIDGGDLHTCARTPAGEVWCWGLAIYGELGAGAVTSRFLPVKSNLARVAAPGVPVALEAATATTLPTTTAGAIQRFPWFVKVVDANGLGVPGVVVTFTITEGDGSFDVGQPGVTTVQATTNAIGGAGGGFRLGTTAGRNTFTATVAGLAGSPVTFTMTGVIPGPPAKIDSFQSPGSPPPVGTATVGAGLSVVGTDLRDAQGFVIPNWPVRFTPLTSGTTMVPYNGVILTTADGRITFPSWTIDTVAKLNEIRVDALDANDQPIPGVSYTFRVNGVAGAVTKFGFIGLPATATSGAAIPDFQVELRDKYGNLATNYNGSVSLFIIAPPGATSVYNANAAQGIATFSGITLNGSGAFKFIAGVVNASSPAVTVTVP